MMSAREIDAQNRKMCGSVETKSRLMKDELPPTRRFAFTVRLLLRIMEPNNKQKYSCKNHIKMDKWLQRGKAHRRAYPSIYIAFASCHYLVTKSDYSVR
jgi:hypothetical protein